MEFLRDAPTDVERGIAWKRLCGVSCWRNCASGKKNGPKKYPEARERCSVSPVSTSHSRAGAAGVGARSK
jgi:hypothetical protein